MSADRIIERGRRVLNLEAAALADVEQALGEDFSANERHVCRMLPIAFCAPSTARHGQGPTTRPPWPLHPGGTHCHRPTPTSREHGRANDSFLPARKSDGFPSAHQEVGEGESKTEGKAGRGKL
jgi:hypothetical protein